LQKAALYVGYSSQQEQGWSLEAHEKTLTEYAKPKGLLTLKELSKSAKKRRRKYKNEGWK